MSIEFKKVPQILPTLPEAPTGSLYFDVALPSTTADGYVYNFGTSTTWAAIHDAATGSSANNSITPGVSSGMAAGEDSGKSGQYWIYRSFLYFDLSSLPADAVLVSGTLRVHTYDYATNVPPNQWADSSVIVQQGTQADTLTTADFDSFTGSEFGRVVWKKYNVNYIDLNSTALSYLEAQVGSTAKLCLREYEHDFLDSAPPNDTAFRNGIFYREAETYDFQQALGGIYHREYIPFLHLYYELPWEGTPPSTSSTSKSFYALDGPTSFITTDWNHDLRISPYIYAQNASWAGARDATTATNLIYGDSASNQVRVLKDSKGAYYSVYRSLLAFDLAEITDEYEITSAQIRLRSNGSGGAGTPKVDVYQGTWDYTIAADDFDSFTGGSLLTAPVSWAADENYMTLTLNQDGIDYLKANAGKIIYFCFREYDHDVSNVAPTVNGEYYAGYFYGTGQGADSTYDPRLTVTYDYRV